MKNESDRPMETHEGEERHRVTPKGLAWHAAIHHGLISGDEEGDRIFDNFWNEFELWMYKKGYIRQEEED